MFIKSQKNLRWYKTQGGQTPPPLIELSFRMTKITALYYYNSLCKIYLQNATFNNSSCGISKLSCATSGCKGKGKYEQKRLSYSCFLDESWLFSIVIYKSNVQIYAIETLRGIQRICICSTEREPAQGQGYRCESGLNTFHLKLHLRVNMLFLFDWIHVEYRR